MDQFPNAHCGVLWGPDVGPHIFSCHYAHICKLYGAPPKTELLSPLCNKRDTLWEREKHRKISLRCLTLCFLFMFAAYAVIANGQVECPKGFKKMNGPHCQGMIQYVEKYLHNSNCCFVFYAYYIGCLIMETHRRLCWILCDRCAKNVSPICFHACMDPLRASINVHLALYRFSMRIRSNLC